MNSTYSNNRVRCIASYPTTVSSRTTTSLLTAYSEQRALRSSFPLSSHTQGRGSLNFWFVKAIERFDSLPKSRAHDISKVAGLLNIIVCPQFFSLRNHPERIFLSGLLTSVCPRFSLRNHPERIFLSSQDVMQMSLSVLFHVLLVGQ